jgi:ABC-type multidrug transport system fused ATPase/permease subunit
MYFDLVTRPPPQKIFRHIRRRSAQLLGILLILAGLAASSLPLLFVIVAAISFLSPSVDFPDMDFGQAVVFLIATLVAIVGLILGLKLIRGRRRLVLFLRRFGYDEATEALSFAAASAMGQRWRLVTLDDNEIAPILGIKSRGRILGFLRWLFLAAMVVGLFWLFGDGFANYMANIIDSLETGNRGRGFDAILGQIIVIFVMTLVIGLFIGGLVLMFIALLGAGMLFSWRSFRSYKKAEMGQSKKIENTSEIEPVIHAVLKMSRKIFAPRLVVVRVNSAIWQAVVEQFAGVSAVILIDVSSPGEGLLWELENLKEKYSKRTVLIGQYEALEKLADLPVTNADAVDREQHLVNLLQGEVVLAYRSGGVRDTQHFTSLLRARLNELF